YYRKQGKRYEQAFDESKSEHHHESTGHYQLPEQVLQQKRHAKALHKAVIELPPDQREVFLLFHEGDLTLQQIAEITHQPKERIKSRYRYALKKLKNTLQVLLWTTKTQTLISFTKKVAKPNHQNPLMTPF